jgi:hypothetical protein
LGHSMSKQDTVPAPEQIEALRAAFPRLGIMDFKAALRHSQSLDEAKSWLAFKNKTVI